MTTLMLAPDFFPLVTSGLKRSTIRLGKRALELGPAEFRSEEMSIRITITSVRHCRLNELTHQDALMDGFQTLAALRRELRRFYPHIAESDDVTVVLFERRNEVAG